MFKGAVVPGGELGRSEQRADGVVELHCIRELYPCHRQLDHEAGDRRGLPADQHEIAGGEAEEGQHGRGGGDLLEQREAKKEDEEDEIPVAHVPLENLERVVQEGQREAQGRAFDHEGAGPEEVDG
ncbi:hypothetical protein [Zoogloea sp. 1C4]|uniref:hypothetical protein n=1 Tax=Zoogloea sp. 1C4 TaxID=2570190 RepID=UPI0012909566|nr:hypothetical protein [Zoogloea sp. 1C4]